MRKYKNENLNNFNEAELEEWLFEFSMTEMILLMKLKKL